MSVYQYGSPLVERLYLRLTSDVVKNARNRILTCEGGKPLDTGDASLLVCLDGSVDCVGVDSAGVLLSVFPEDRIGRRKKMKKREKGTKD